MYCCEILFKKNIFEHERDFYMDDRERRLVKRKREEQSHDLQQAKGPVSSVFIMLVLFHYKGTSGYNPKLFLFFNF